MDRELPYVEYSQWAQENSGYAERNRRHAALFRSSDIAVHTIAPDETLEDIAVYWYCGEGFRWDNIFTLNKWATDAELRLHNTTRLVDADAIPAGARIVVPEPDRSPATRVCNYALQESRSGRDVNR